MIWLCKLPLSIRFRHILTYIKEVMNDGIDIKKNSAAEISEKCTEDNTAIKLGSGKSPVYATPALVALMENAAINACDPQLPEGYNTVASP